MPAELSAIIVGVISVTGSIIVQLIVSAQKNRELDAKSKEADAKRAASEQEQKDRLDEIERQLVVMEKKIDEHNGYARKFSEIEKTLAVMQKDIEYWLRERSKNDKSK